MVTAPSLDSLRDARRRAERLFERVSEDALYDRSIGERHRLVFYIGHLEAFDWNLIGAGHFRLPPIHPAFDRLFAFGIDPPPGQLPCDQPSDWPALNAIAEYGARIREAVDRLWEETPAQLRHVAIEHRLMHVETLQYLLHALPLWKLRAERAEHPATASEAT
ncbi:MAG TPA: ergothioneine biosynthesis protein EgtB, partial [Solibacterales bacterium]|nr:ergothioneine biosynthesis protein EgtB [Bryobacterales bacterium]